MMAACLALKAQTFELSDFFLGQIQQYRTAAVTAKRFKIEQICTS
jgi:hypothetical protein